MTNGKINFLKDRTIDRATAHHILAADIGGTNSRFAHFTASEAGGLSLASAIWLKTAEAGSFSGLLANLKASAFPLPPEEADIVGIAIAGPVIGGKKSSPPLIPWDIDISQAQEDFGFKRSFLINDFVAQAYACVSPAAESAEVILEGFPDRQSAIAVIGAGTGLGKACVIPYGRGGYFANPSEGAHAAFPLIGERECRFQQFLTGMHRTTYATYNHVVSGRGLAALHEFLTGMALEPAQVAEQFPQYPETLAWFARFYGRACRDFALETLSLGGLYIAGGLAARNPEIARHKSFRDEFLASDAMLHVLARLPVCLIRDQNSGLWGAAEKAALEMAGGRNGSL